MILGILDIFQILGAVGLIFVTIGILLKERKKQDIFFIVGGIFLEIYSISIKNLIFIILQLVFTVATGYDFVKEVKKGKK
jgi:hypothetical protein